VPNFLIFAFLVTHEALMSNSSCFYHTQVPFSEGIKKKYY